MARFKYLHIRHTTSIFTKPKAFCYGYIWGCFIIQTHDGTCPTNGRSIIQHQWVGTIQSLSSLTLWRIAQKILGTILYTVSVYTVYRPLPGRSCHGHNHQMALYIPLSPLQMETVTKILIKICPLSTDGAF